MCNNTKPTGEQNSHFKVLGNIITEQGQFGFLFAWLEETFHNMGLEEMANYSVIRGCKKNCNSTVNWPILEVNGVGTVVS